MEITGPPAGPVRVPPLARRLATGAALDAVWENEVGGITFRVGDDRYLKWTPAGAPIDLTAERDRLLWAAPHTPVPRPLALEADEDGSCLVTEAVRGRSAVDDRWLADPETAVRAIGRGLRALHDALPVESCPFDFSVPERLERARSAGLSPDPALEEAPPIDRLVVCHGDACAPNTLLDDSGEWTAHVDLGRLGVADRWADLAVATWSTEWNYGADWTDLLLEAYGAARDEERIAYYRAVWDAT
ncbi:aminoglycoside 3'-phosphotransferase [Naasia sp. SYSU D00948]|uniref:aminoglycoside 3'-phosphotransferase n=1 Tax=Naasia sp. SYSU D00948 TaxID=2817379 RepID=UPI001B30B7E6|nr:aminoglycoside 3'-phosphotransferase [Naasia sp. SYSU D00948]